MSWKIQFSIFRYNFQFFKARFNFQFLCHLWVLHWDYLVLGKLTHTLPFSSYPQLWIYRGFHTHGTFPACLSKLFSYSCHSSLFRGPLESLEAGPRPFRQNIEVLGSQVPKVWFWLGFPGSTSGKESACQCRIRRRHRLDPWVGKIPWRRKWHPTPVFLLTESQGQWSLLGYGPWWRRVRNYWASEHTHDSC